MAGICGIILKNQSIEASRVDVAFAAMLLKLAATTEQQSKTVSLRGYRFGNVIPLSQNENTNYIFNQEYAVYCILDGFVYIADMEKQLLHKRFKVENLSSDYEYLPYLYLSYGSDFIKHITGCYNIFILDEKKQLGILINDRLGFLPLFLYESANVIMFASKIESILATGLMNSIEPDHVSISEQLLFNYSLSEHSLIRNISTLPAASVCTISGSKIRRSSYWNPGELICTAPLSHKKSVDLIDETLNNVIHKPLLKNNEPFWITLTGGWDGRLILSYILDKYRSRIRSFSFGAESSPDITIPLMVARKENFSYTPFVLDQAYIDQSFIEAASRTILYSNGARSYKRTHYLHVIQKLTGGNDTYISGNFGDEVLKFSRITPGEVVSAELINYVQSDFSTRPSFPLTTPFSSQKVNNNTILEEWNARFHQFERELSGYYTISQKYFHLKLTRIAARYFGYEVNSYNDFRYNNSPFLDHDFLTNYSKTLYASFCYPFNGNKLKHKEMISVLYAELIKRNQKNLLNYTTERGYSIADIISPIGKLKVYYKKKFGKSFTGKDPYFLSQADNLFSNFIENAGINKVLPDSISFTGKNGRNANDKILSIIYWLNHINKNYSIQ
jgi:hypothetical protein